VDRYGRTPPVYAIWNGHAAVDKRLLRAYRRYPRGPPKITQKINNTTFDWIECFSSLKMCTNYTCWSSDNCSPSFSRIINVLVSFGSPFLTRCKTAWTSATFPGVLLRWFGSTGSYGRDWGFSASGGVEIILLLDQGDPFPTLPGVFCTSATSLWYSSRPKLSLEQHAKPLGIGIYQYYTLRRCRLCDHTLIHLSQWTKTTDIKRLKHVSCVGRKA
jgi:hypothetical protein